MYSTQLQNDDDYQAKSYAERKLAEGKESSFWCFNALIPFKVGVHTFVKVQFGLDVGLGFVCLVLFFFIGSLLKVRSIQSVSFYHKRVYIGCHLLPR
jgi:hypothetical protein